MENLILGIDCSGGMTSVALASEEEPLGETNALLGRRQSQVLPRMASHLLRIWNVDFQDLSAIAVTRGPGFFSGIRVGMSYALSLAFSLGIPVISLSSLEVLAFGVALEEVPVMSLLPAKRGAYFCGAYLLRNGNFDSLEEEVFLAEEAVVEKAKKLSATNSLWCAFDSSCSQSPFFGEMPVTSVKTYIQGLRLVSLARKKKTENPEEVHPSYLRITW
ncbi:MAG TPA: tRNA (adenosine(37)-N6)-threonylcarbamoyltransferase complex dimerization subunit type 1 TsaB [Synergistaceae bacterium]|nr:tRNA (adenosine(37)-N6)-threonylcarbamoyltransferase complex dimerization subunit type 1 TsaB [Synergistaceae bacterium]HPJ26517.1 tRNA (adenosine(37)-N6)-threonylcarbamoyltransferase complex dimerization subunit type 1 TsaB [Synergistaceae bacterium]HPQ37974.1 tRNA (adenosine(37)-N6)-threonylcarbamoyltransferase complex dimerization subunit type 1 TsaB [Synergistaceae bacterium]